MRLASKLVDQVTIVVEDRAVGDDLRRAPRRIQLGGDLRVQNPQLAFESGRGVHRKRRLARDFGDQFDVVMRFFKQRTEFVGECGLADAVRADECKFQNLLRFKATLFLTQFQQIRERRDPALHARVVFGQFGE